jgi:outer membrane lipoprotein-sorting protein
MMLRHFALTTFSLTGVLFSSVAASGQDASPHLNEVLRQMDAASLKFKSAEADFRKELYQRVIRDTTTQNGSIYFLKSGNALQMGAVFSPPEAKIVEYKEGRLRLFDPGPNHLTEMDGRNNQAQYESFLTLGFGGSGKDLEKTWNITDQGAESLNDGSGTVTVEKLDLVAKDPSQRNSIAHVTIWVDPTRAISLKQEFFFTSEDTQTAFYTHIRYNQSVNTKRYAIKTDSKTTR